MGKILSRSPRLDAHAMDTEKPVEFIHDDFDEQAGAANDGAKIYDMIEAAPSGAISMSKTFIS